MKDEAERSSSQKVNMKQQLKDFLLTASLMKETRKYEYTHDKDRKATIIFEKLPTDKWIGVEEVSEPIQTKWIFVSCSYNIRGQYSIEDIEWLKGLFTEVVRLNDEINKEVK